MVTLRKFWFGFLPSLGQIIAMRFVIPQSRQSRVRLKHARVLSGIAFLILLIVLLLLLPDSAVSQAPYLRFEDLPNMQPAGLVADPGFTNSYPTGEYPILQDTILQDGILQDGILPVTGR